MHQVRQGGRSCRASCPFVRPQARPGPQTEPGSSPSIQNVDHTPQSFGIEIAIDANATAIPNLNYDQAATL
jgi:hypothetical protein